MHASLGLLIAAVVFGFGFAAGQAAFNALVGLLNRNR